MKYIIGFLCVVGLLSFQQSQSPTLQLALLKYNGGGDWYANPTALTNLAAYSNTNLGTNFQNEYATVEVGDLDIYNFPFLHMTGHGNVVFSDAEAENLRMYLTNGGFLHIDDNYGMDPFVRPALKKVFPDVELVELPFSHDVYHQSYDFNSGLPKIHEHDDQPSQGFGILWEGRVVVFYSYQSDLGDGWEDQEVHNDPEDIRQKALKMGLNLIEYAFLN